MCSETAVRKAIATGRLATFEDGSLPVEAVEFFGAEAAMTRANQGVW
jgi:hypothetical protein